MTFGDIFFIGVGLAIDASCVCTSNGLIYRPSRTQSVKLALVYAIFQAIMPLIGYFGVGLFSFTLFEYNQLMALVLLSIMGIKMIYESLEERKQSDKERIISCGKSMTVNLLLVQGISTSIDAFSVGITWNNYPLEFVCCGVALIALITLIMCYLAVRIGIRIGTKLNHKAGLLGGFVLVLLGIKIFVVG